VNDLEVVRLTSARKTDHSQHVQKFFRGFMQYKVLLCDDSQIFREVAKKFLEAHSLVHLVGESSNFADSLRMVSDLRPDIAILDLCMVPETAVKLPTQKNVLNAKRLLVVSASSDQESRDLADRMGADAFLDKIDLYDKLIATIVWLTSVASAHPMRLQTIG
jgi:DNA-binding NarL/FixJ family response regulator